MSERRIDELEAALAFQERAIEELNEMVTRQWAEIDALKRDLATMRTRLVEVEAHPALSSGEEPPPPHY